ncbi:hypothetical protein SCE1572_28910 [Sorangium cellulosum So0157-2]|uniref:Uncharacterized protein n=1 Tax=Sorangium cellulosum So0157-2 TaxID=1254432 RepID=S4Y1T9_SORCE|nr:hypothetical protein SCE1572_28910 [Sorangium cellulosum So0157-2]
MRLRVAILISVLSTFLMTCQRPPAPQAPAAECGCRKK